MTMLLITLVALAAGFMAGSALASSRGHKRGLAEGRKQMELEIADPKPICACEHNYAYHDPETSVCHGVTYLKVKGMPIMSPGGTYVVANEPGTTVEKPCTCRRYTGPEPLPRYIP